MTELQPVVSSHISAIGYDPETLELVVEYKTGKRSTYSQIDPSTAKVVMEAPSVGQALHMFVRGKYLHR